MSQKLVQYTVINNACLVQSQLLDYIYTITETLDKITNYFTVTNLSK